jgi:hypothetical protein
MLPPEMQLVGERLVGAQVFQFWNYHNMLFTISTNLLRGIQWYLDAAIALKPIMLHQKMQIVEEGLDIEQVFLKIFVIKLLNLLNFSKLL